VKQFWLQLELQYVGLSQQTFVEPQYHAFAPPEPPPPPVQPLQLELYLGTSPGTTGQFCGYAAQVVPVHACWHPVPDV